MGYMTGTEKNKNLIDDHACVNESMFWLIYSISNTMDSVSSGYPNTEKRVENTKRRGVFLTKFEVLR